jgi:microcystin-dependent protein
MSEPFLGELRLMSFNFPPKGWAFCNGQLMPINQNQALFALLGTTYGGNGQSNFQLPDLRGRTPIHVGASTGVVQGMQLGEEFHTLTAGELPQHVHFMNASATPADQTTPGVLAAGANLYRDGAPTSSLHPATVSNRGGGMAHENRQPFLVLNWCIAIVSGIFPSRN